MAVSQNATISIWSRRTIQPVTHIASQAFTPVTSSLYFVIVPCWSFWDFLVSIVHLQSPPLSSSLSYYQTHHQCYPIILIMIFIAITCNSFPLCYKDSRHLDGNPLQRNTSQAGNEMVICAMMVVFDKNYDDGKLVLSLPGPLFQRKHCLGRPEVMDRNKPHICGVTFFNDFLHHLHLKKKKNKGHLHVGVGTGGLVGPIPTRGPDDGFALLSNYQATDFSTLMLFSTHKTSRLKKVPYFQNR